MGIGFRPLLITAVLVGLIILAPSGMPTNAHAQDATPTAGSEQAVPRFGILPADSSYGSYFSDIVVEPGETVTLEAAILNVGEDSIRLRAYTANVSSGPNGGFVASTPDEPLTAPASWISFPTFEDNVDSKSQTNVSFTVTVPEGTPSGQYISAVVVETVETFQIPGNNMFDQRLRYALAVGVVVPGELTPMFELGQPIIDRGILEVPITNTGNYLVKPTGKLKVTNSEGEEVTSAPVEMASVYAGTSTTLSGNLPEQLPPPASTRLILSSLMKLRVSRHLSAAQSLQSRTREVRLASSFWIHQSSQMPRISSSRMLV